ncbi:amino acid ABC transporter permease [Streptomyces sp. NPDC002513]
MRLRHPLRWVSAFLVMAGLAALGMAFAHAQIDWHVVGEFFAAKVVLSGFVHTLIISALAMLLGLAISVVFAVMRLSSNPVTSAVAWLYVWLFRGTPAILQLLMWFNIALVFPVISIPGIYHGQTVHVVTPFVAALLGLGVNEGAYLTEVVRAGIRSVDEGQTEAASALGLSRLQTLRTVVMPQALRLIVPPIGNEAIGMLKTSSLATVISYTEVLNSAQQIYFVNGRVMELLIVCAIWYMIATSVLSTAQYFLEARIGRGGRRGRPRTLAERAVAAVLDRALRSKKAVTS